MTSQRELLISIFEGGYEFRQEYGYSLSTLGSSYRYLGWYEQAEKYLKDALEIARSVDSPSKLRVIVFYIVVLNFLTCMDTFRSKTDRQNVTLARH